MDCGSLQNAMATTACLTWRTLGNTGLKYHIFITMMSQSTIHSEMYVGEIYCREFTHSQVRFLRLSEMLDHCGCL